MISLEIFHPEKKLTLVNSNTNTWTKIWVKVERLEPMIAFIFTNVNHIKHMQILKSHQFKNSFLKKWIKIYWS